MCSRGDWRHAKLGQLVRGIRGVSYQPDDLKNDVTETTAVLLRANNIQSGQLLYDDIQIIPRNIIKAEQFIDEGDIVVCMSNGSKHLVGKSAQYKGDYNGVVTVGAFCSLFKVREGTVSAYVRQLFQSAEYQGHIDFSLAGSAINNLKNSDIEEMDFLVPPKPIQEKISNILDRIDQAIDKTEVLIEKYQKIKAGLMHDLFTRGIGADGKPRPPREQAPELYQETSIGWVPNEWQNELLDSLAFRGSGHTPNKNYSEYWNGGIKWISLADSFRLDQLYIEDTEYEISELGVQNSSATVHPAGIVVLSRDAGVGKSAITTRPMAVSQHFMCWRCNGSLDKYFLYYWLQYKKRMFENIAMGSTILTIGLPYFKKLRIAVPRDINEQQKIGERLKSADLKIFSLEKNLNKLKQQKLGLMNDLLTGRVEVKPDQPEAVHV